MAALAIACAVAGLYLIYVAVYAVNAPEGDDWGPILLVDMALHGHLTLGALWAQHLENRMLFPNLFFVAAGLIDHYDVRTIIIFNALIYIASFFLLLTVVRAYINRRLTAVPTLILSLVWFSLAAAFDALWGFQFEWYLVILMFVSLLYVLLVAKIRWEVRLTLAIGAAVVASYSSIQGLLLWPVGLLLLLWVTPWRGWAYIRAGVWFGAAAVTTGIYLRHFDFGSAIYLCPHKAKSVCTLGFALAHPATLATYWLHLVGNLVPTTTSSTSLPQELLGLVLSIVSTAIVVQSFRERRQGMRIPLPLTCIVFAALFDAAIVFGRSGFGNPGYVEYTFPQLLLLSGIVIYAWGHLPTGGHVPTGLFASSADGRPLGTRTIGYVAVAVFVAFQAFMSTVYGLEEGRSLANYASGTARVVVNLAQTPPEQVQCYVTEYVYHGLPINAAVQQRLDAIARSDGLSMFSPGVYRTVRAEGRPRSPLCK